jgi:hypothetical protein
MSDNQHWVEGNGIVACSSIVVHNHTKYDWDIYLVWNTGSKPIGALRVGGQLLVTFPKWGLSYDIHARSPGWHTTEYRSYIATQQAQGYDLYVSVHGRQN